MAPHPCPDATISVSVTPTFREYLRLNFWLTFRKAWLLLVLGALGLAWFLASPLLFQGDAVATKYLHGLPMLTLPALAFVLVPALTWGAARQRWNAAAEIREPRTYTFSDDGVRVAAQTFEGFTAWSNIAGAARVGEQV